MGYPAPRSAPICGVPTGQALSRTVLLPAFHSDYQVANRALARIVSAGAGRFIGFAMVHPDRDAGRMAQLVDTAVTAYGFRGHQGPPA